MTPPWARSAVPAAVSLAIVVVSSSANAGDYFDGSEIYEQYCQSCHGERGRSTEPGLPDFSRGERLFAPDSDLIRAIRSGKGAMPGFRGMLEERQIRDVVTFLRSLQT